MVLSVWDGHRLLIAGAAQICPTHGVRWMGGSQGKLTSFDHCEYWFLLVVL